MKNWKRINRNRLPKTGVIIAGSWRKGYFGEGWEWSMCSPSERGWPRYVDDDRTHYIRLPNPPKRA